ncbi:CPBP family intramembrane glutamic endopeptidase [Lacticigenium naphthae]|uniref:CPBP family intramembrane glutamic endopeptidase n=1 Tax=Lacticigenium naphthae TaxID=515351 RepID=UPI000408F69A|nr:type II CAAX endopeptidase family protein [Lacticigenium naphthae]
MLKKIPKPALSILLIYILAQLSPALVVVFANDETIVQASIYGSLISFTIGAILMTWIHFRKPLSNSIENSQKSALVKIVGWSIGGMLLALFVQNIAIIIEQNLLGIPQESANTQSLLEIVRHFPIFILLISIAGPVMEEFVFRKVLFGGLIDHIGGIGAAVVSSLAFAFIHFDGHILLYSSMGFVFSYIYYKTKSISTPIIAHALMNTAAILANLLILD